MQANQIYNKQLNKKDNLQKARKTDKNTQYQANLNVQKSENSEIFAKPIQLKNNNILLKIPESNIVIYQDRISYCLQQNRNKLTQEKEKTGQKGLSSITNLQTNFSLQQIFLEKSIYFSNSNLAFKYLEDKKIFKIIQLTRTARNQKINLQIKIQDKQTRSVLQQILKKKICQIGFQDQFQVIKQIGKGATSKVYLVVRRWDKKQFAAKIISLSDSQQKSYNTFINENRILKALKNPHIVSLEGLYISHKKELISVLQYLKGGSLLQQLRQRKINTKFQKLKAIKDITLGIQHMRQKRIVHRDLKLENIMVRINSDQTKDYVITDMGLSNWIGQKYIIYQKCGTPGYIAPQVLSMEKGSCLLSHSTDIFSLGVLFHYILMIEPLFPYDGNTKQLLRLNKIANFNLYIEKYHCLTKQQFALLRVTLQIQPQKRASAKQLVQVYVSNYQKYVAQIQNKKRSNYQIELFGAKRQKYTNNVNTQIAKQKSGASKQKSFNTNCKSQRSIQIIGQKNVSLTKKAINVNSSKQLKQMGKAQKNKFGQYLQKSQKSSSIDNAKKIVSRVIDKINFFSKSKDKDKNKSIDKNDKKLIKASNNDLNMNLNSSRLSGLKVKDIQKSRNQMKSYLDD